MSPSQFKALRKQLGWTQTETMVFLGLGSVETIAAYERPEARTRGAPFAYYELMRRELERTQQSVPIVASVPAGPLSSSDPEDVLGWLAWERPNLNDTFYALVVHGSSMTRYSIRDGDIVVIRAQSTADRNADVVALINGESTLKRYDVANGHPILTGDHSHVVVDDPEDFQILGIVVDVLHGGGQQA